MFVLELEILIKFFPYVSMFYLKKKKKNYIEIRISKKEHYQYSELMTQSACPFGIATYACVELKFARVSGGPNVVEKYCELREIYGVRYPAEHQ